MSNTTSTTQSLTATSASPGSARGTYSVAGLLAWVVTGCVAGGGAGAGLMLAAGSESSVVLIAAAWAVGAWLIAAGLTTALLVLITRGEVDRLGLAVLFLSFMRMLIATGLALLVWFVLARGAAGGSLGGGSGWGGGFWAAFLGAGLVCLAAETLWAVRTINRSARVAPVTAASSMHFFPTAAETPAREVGA